MLRKLLFAIVPMVLAVSTVSADETIDLNLSNINDAAIEIEDVSLDGLDVDALADKADGEGSDEAIEACFRRFGYRHRGYRYGGYGYSSYRPYYSYRQCYPTYYCYRPVHYYSYPVVSYHRNYWGCY
jgi:hypothetical protein